MKTSCLGPRRRCVVESRRWLAIGFAGLLGIPLFLTTSVASGSEELVTWGANTYGQGTVPDGLSNVVAVVAGDSHNLALRADGTVVAWGDNVFGQTNVPAGLSNAVSVASKGYHDLALLANGTVVAWGYNYYGQSTVPAGLTNIVAVAGGTFHSLALRENGTVVAWGRNVEGQTNVPVFATNIVALAAGQSHSLALRSDGTVVAWGAGEATVPAGISNVVAISAGEHHNLALRNNGTVVAWGYNASSQATVPNGLSNVVAISAGEFHSLALLTDGTVRAWGDTTYGQASVPPGLTNVVAVSGGGYHSFALLSGDRPPFFRGPLLGQTVFAGATARFLVNAAAPFYQWRLNGVDLPGATNNPLVLTNVMFNQAGNYSVLVSNNFGTATSISAPLTVIPFLITNQPASQTVFAGEVASFNVGVSNFVPISYQWRLNGTNVNGATNNPLVLTNATVAQAGEYSVAVIHSDGFANSSNALLTVIPLQITNQPVSKAVLIGSSVSFSVGVKSVLPLNYQWRQNGVELDGATNNVLTLPDVRQNQGGNYSVVVSNAEGFVTSSNALLSVMPFIISNTSTSQTALAGSTVSFGVSSESSLTLTYQWRFEGNDLPDATNNPLILTNMTVGQSGNYSVFISNSAAMTTVSNAVLTVVPLFITNQPTSQVALVGGMATFSVGAQSSFPVTYQWRFQGTNLTAATNAFLTLANLDLAQEGSYSVVVSNSAGAVTSGNASLTVSTFIGWGANYAGQLNIPPGIGAPLAVAAGQNHGLALLVDRTVTAWGNSSLGAAVVPEGLSNVIAIAAGQYHSLALREDGTVAAWGYDRSGQTNVPIGLNNVVAVAGGGSHSLALRTGGTIIAWGSVAQTNTPPAASNVVAIAAGAIHSMALRAAGTVVAWGNNTFGQTNVPAGLTNVIAVAAGFYHSLALRSDGTVDAWGRYDLSRMGGQVLVFVPASLSNIVAIAGGTAHSLALSADGNVIVWGYNFNGETNLPVGLTKVAAIVPGHTHSFALIGGPPIRRAPATNFKRNGSTFSLQIPTRSGRVYGLEYKDAFNEALWRRLPLVAGTGETKTLVDPSISSNNRFYRVSSW